MRIAGSYQFPTMESVIYGKPAAEALREEAERLNAKRVYLIVSRTLNTKTDEIEKIRKALGDRHAETFDGVPQHTTREAVVRIAKQAKEAKADLVVAVLCNDYENKEWCGLEWNAIYGLIMQRKAGEVMLCRFDRVEGKGLFGLAGFIDLDDKTPAEAATLITERLALNEGYPKDYYTRDTPAGSDWPAVAPSLDWPVADPIVRRIGRESMSRTLATVAAATAAPAEVRIARGIARSRAPLQGRP